MSLLLFLIQDESSDDALITLISGIVVVFLFLGIVRVFGAWMLRINDVVDELKKVNRKLTKIEIKQNMIEHFAENDDVADIKLVDLKLVHKGGNEYKGIADVIIENPVADLLNDWSEQDILKKNIEVTYSVEVIYDGEMFSWEIQE
jgi:uncharacterized membrane-anchored protein YhcB (DUF1043 family)